MATTRKSKKTEKTETKTKDTGPKYGVPELAEATGLQPASIRVGLRDSEFEKSGRQWGWETKKDFDEVVKWFKARAEKQPTKKEATSEKKPTRRSKKSKT